MWVDAALETLSGLDAASDEQSAFDLLVNYAGSLGIEMVSYHHNAPNIGGVPGEVQIFSNGFPEAWVKIYRENDLVKIDPITSYTLTQTRPILWSQIGEKVDILPEQAKYLDQLWDWLSPGDGMAVPLFGPGGRHGYVGMGSRKALVPWDGVRIRLTQMVCEAFHLRFTELHLHGMPLDFSLTEREREVLSRIANGHASWLVAAVIGVGPDVIEASLQSIFAKMGVTDRASAILRARGLGLIED